jgi:hypothetical protein
MTSINAVVPEQKKKVPVGFKTIGNQIAILSLVRVYLSKNQLSPFLHYPSNLNGCMNINPTDS